MTRKTFVSTTILLQMAGCTAVQVSRRHLEVEPLKKNEEPWFFFLFCPVVCSKVPVKKSYGNKNNVEAVPKVGSKDLHCKPFLDETLSWIAN